MTQALTITEQNELEQHEQVIKQGLETFVSVGNALLAIRERRLYRAEHGTFEEYCQGKWGIVRQQANRLIAASQAVRVLEPMGSKLPESERQARPLTGLKPEQQRKVWQAVVEESQETGERITGKKVQEAVDYGPLVPGRNYREKNGVKHCEACGQLWAADLPYCPYCNISREARIAYVQEERKTSKPHVSQNSGNNEWYTPAEYIEAARHVMGGIDCDPASSEIANKTVKATAYYTIETDGLSNPWSGRVWMNPPYSQPLIVQFCNALAEKYKSGEISEACVLVNNASETAWFDMLAECAICRCDVGKRIRFIDKDGNPGGGPLQGQVVLYFGPNDTKFADTFEQFGRIWHAW